MNWVSKHHFLFWLSHNMMKIKNWTTNHEIKNILKEFLKQPTFLRSVFVVALESMTPYLANNSSRMIKQKFTCHHHPSSSGIYKSIYNGGAKKTFCQNYFFPRSITLCSKMNQCMYQLSMKCRSDYVLWKLPY